MKRHIIYAVIIGSIANCLLSYAEKVVLANVAKTQSTIQEIK